LTFLNKFHVQNARRIISENFVVIGPVVFPRIDKPFSVVIISNNNNNNNSKTYKWFSSGISEGVGKWT
jgi:hypothetical protein